MGKWENGEKENAFALYPFSLPHFPFPLFLNYA
jgi:hypothetical protein